MIVGSCFYGDGSINTYVMWRQHDVYHQALGIITGICQEYMELTYRLIDDPTVSWEPIDYVDHRTIQHAHDILTVVWRFRYEKKLRQMELPGCSPCLYYFCPSRIEGRKIYPYGLRMSRSALCPAAFGFNARKNQTLRATGSVGLGRRSALGRTILC